MYRSVAPDRYPDVRPLEMAAALIPWLRRLSVLAALIVALAVVVLVSAFVPLATWLVLAAGIAAPTIASMFLVAVD